MIWFDRLSVLLLFALGCIHNFVAAPAVSDVLTTRLLWFVTGGITLWFAAIINLLWLRTAADRFAASLAALANLVLLGFAAMFVATKGSYSDPQNLALLLPAAWLAAQSVAAVIVGRRT
ncbi:MAG: hypothetical protein JNK07_08840 [Alphaproteobacteria bacterium]|nr:hypothetical protein [Alphaproteobacteria bacterium]